MSKKQFVKIPNTIVRNNGITNNSKMAYVTLALNKELTRGIHFMPNTIHGMLNIAGYKQRTENTNTTRQALIELEELKLIKLYEDMNLEQPIKAIDLKGTTYWYYTIDEEYAYSDEFMNRFDTEELDYELIEAGFTFTAVYVTDAVKLFANKSEKNRANMISLYLMAICRALIGDTGDGYSLETMEDLIKYANVDRKTAIKLLNSMFEHEILFKVTMRMRKAKTDHNAYSRWCDKGIIVHQIKVGDGWFGNKRLMKVGNKLVNK
jgi:hypothetical protein